MVQKKWFGLIIKKGVGLGSYFQKVGPVWFFLFRSAGLIWWYITLKTLTPPNYSPETLPLPDTFLCLNPSLYKPMLLPTSNSSSWGICSPPGSHSCRRKTVVRRLHQTAAFPHPIWCCRRLKPPPSYPKWCYCIFLCTSSWNQQHHDVDQPPSTWPVSFKRQTRHPCDGA